MSGAGGGAKLILPPTKWPTIQSMTSVIWHWDERWMPAVVQNQLHWSLLWGKSSASRSVPPVFTIAFMCDGRPTATQHHAPFQPGSHSLWPSARLLPTNANVCVSSSLSVLTTDAICAREKTGRSSSVMTSRCQLAGHIGV